MESELYGTCTHRQKAYEKQAQEEDYAYGTENRIYAEKEDKTMIGLTCNKYIGTNTVTVKVAVVPMREMRQSSDKGEMLNAAERNPYGGKEGFSVRQEPRDDGVILRGK